MSKQVAKKAIPKKEMTITDKADFILSSLAGLYERLCVVNRTLSRYGSGHEECDEGPASSGLDYTLREIIDTIESIEETVTDIESHVGVQKKKPNPALLKSYDMDPEEDDEDGDDDDEQVLKALKKAVRR